MGELISYVKGASGRVKDKEHWIDCVKNRLYVLGSYGVEKEQLSSKFGELDFAIIILKKEDAQISQNILIS